MMEGRGGVFFLLCCAAVLSLGGAQTGFISIDCGLTATRSYTNVQSDNLTYVSDDGYVETGVNMALLDPNALDGKTNEVYKTVRSFPNATRSCYHLPATVGTKYLLRAAFMYGNYDGLNSPPGFRLYLGVDLWDTVTLANSTHVVRSELVTQAAASVLYVCLVKTGGGTPFISSLKLRPLPNSLYAPANSSIALMTFRRVDVGATKSTWYPADRFDRIWESDYDSYGSPKSTNATVIEYMNLSFGIPSAVLQTAVYSTGEITLGWPGGDGSAFFLVLEFADVVPPASGKPRHLTIQLNGQYWIDVNVSYLSSSVIYTRSVLSLDQYSFTIRSTNASDEGAVLNSFEIYKVLPLSGSATNADDVSAIMAIKEYYQLKKYWVADPCLPQNSPWDGLTCDNSPIPRIVTLDLSNNGLDGKISGHISKLTALKTLNLSTNNLNGQVPAFLQDLPNLTKIDLSNNHLSGPIPARLQEKREDGELMLSIENNPLICQQDDCSQDGKSTHKSRTVIVISVVISLLVAIIIIVAVIGTLKRRNLLPTPFNGKRRNEDNHPQQQRVMGYKKSGTFTYSEVVAMTNNFEKVIGKGGSGTVYYGQLKDGREVAVKKVTGLVGQGTNEFQVEVNLLMQIHHKHLAPFIGCCDNDKQMVLIYEYMANGNLRQRLSDETADALNWQQRLHIGLGSAMGLQYLHSGCIPAIIHRDVKSSNILLNENFEAKIADFGLSKSVISSEVTHITTAVAGTIGYLDPEYWYTGRLTEKSDVYGFGIVLFELITGRHAISTHEGESVPIVKIVVPKLLRGEIKSIIDPRLQGQYEMSSIWKVADTAMSCTEEKSFIRPTMTDVVAELKDAMEIEMARQRSGGSRMWKSSRHSFSRIKAPIRSNSLSDTDPDIYPSAR